MNTRRSLRIILATGIAALLSQSASATTYTFTGPGAGTATNPLSGAFGVADSWSGDVLPTFDSTADLSFNFTTGTATAVTATNDLGAITLNSLSVLNNKAGLTITGGTLNFQPDAGTLENPTITNSAGSNQVLLINSAITLGANMTIANNGTGQVQIGNSGTAGAGNIDLGSFTLTLTDTAGSSAFQFGQGGGANRGVITGTGGIVQTLANTGATNAFFGASTFSGGLVLNSGILVVGINSTGTAGAVTSGSFGTGLLTVNGGTIRSTSGGTRTVLNDMLLNGNFTIGDATTTGAIFGGNITLAGNRTITVTAGGTAADLSDRHTISGVIGDGGSAFNFTKSGTGTLVLSGASTYSGTTNVINGSLLVAANAPAGAAGPLGNATSAISLGGTGAAAGNNIGLLVGVPGSTPGAATITIGRDITVGNVNNTGTTTLGTFSNTNAVFSGNIALSKSVLLASSSTGANAANFTGTISGAFGITKTATGVTRLSGANSYTGTTTIRNGTLLAAGDVAVSTNSPLGNAASAIALADGTSGAADNIVLGIDGAFTIARGVTINTNNSTGTSTLTAFNAAATTATYGGTVTLNRNAILANATAGATTLFSGSITDGAGTFGVTVNGPGTVEFGGAGVNAYDGVTNVANGTLLLNRNFGGNNTITGPVTVSGGTLRLGGNEQLPDSLVLTLTGGVLDAANFTETIFDLNYTGGTILNGGNLTITGSQDRFLFDGTTVAAPENVNRHILYLGSTTAATVNAALALDNDASHDLAVNDGAAAVDVIFNSAITNDVGNTPTSLIKKGLGTVSFTAANTFGGAGQTLELQGGVVSVTADNQLGNSANTVTLNGGTLRFDSSFATARTFVAGASAGTLEIPLGLSQSIGSLSGAGTFNKSGAGELIVTGDNSASFSGSASVNGGTLTVSALNNVLGNAASDLTLNGGTLKVATGFALDAGKTITIGAAGGGIQVEPSQTLDLAVSGSLAGGGVVTKSGTGTLLIRDANAGLTAGSAVAVNAGTVELRNAQSLGNTVKSTLTLSGGGLSLVNDTATAFSNPVIVSGPATVQSDVATAGGAAVAHTLGTLSINGSLTGTAGPNALGAQGVTFGAVTLTGNSTLVSDTARITTGAVALGTNSLTVEGAGNTQLAATSGGPGAGLTALTKNGTGLLTLPNTSTFTGNVVINGGVVRGNVAGSFGNTANVVRLNAGGTAGMGTSGMTQALVFNGGTLAGAGVNNGTWNGQPGPTPSITFLTDTTFNLWDAINPATDSDINLGTTTTGVLTSAGPVALVVNANATNTNFATQRKLRFNNTTDGGSVTGTLTINPNAVAQVRGAGTVNALGSGVLIRLDTGINLTTPVNSGRLEFISEVTTDFASNVELLSDSTIGVGRITSATNILLTANNLLIGNHTLSLVDTTGGGSGYNLAFSGTTTLTGSPTFFLSRNLTLASITDGPAAFGITKSGASILTINGGGYDGPTTVSAGTLVLGASSILSATADVAVTGGTFNTGATTQSIGALNVSGGAVFSSAAGGTVSTTGVTISSTANSTVNAVLAGTNGIAKSGTGTLVLGAVNTFAGDVSVTGGNLNISVDNAIPDTANVTVNGGTINFYNGTNNTRSETIANLTMTSGFIRTANGTITTPALINITGTLDVSGGDLAVNSGGSVSANKVILSNVMGVHVIGGNTASQVNELIVGPGGLEFTGSQMRMNVGATGSLGSRLVLNGHVTTFAAATESGVYGESAPGTSGIREINIGTGTRNFLTADGPAFNDLRIDYPLVGSGSLVKDGDGRFLVNGANTFAGDTFVNGGTLAFGPGASVLSPLIEVAGGATFDVLSLGGGYSIASGRELRVDGTVEGSLNVSGTLSGAGLVTGTVGVSIGGTIAPGSTTAGILTVQTSLSFNDDSFLAIGLGGTSPGSGTGFYDQLNMSNAFGTVTLGNNVTLNASVSPGFTPSLSDVFYIFAREDADGFGVPTFASAFEGDTIDLGNGYTGKITYLADWTGSQGGSTLTGGNDVAIYAVVPEPGSAALLLGGLALLASRRRRCTSMRLSEAQP